MRIPANTYLIALLLASPISIAWAADEAAAPIASQVVGSTPLPEEIEEAQRMARVADDLRKKGKFAEAEKTYKDALDRNASRTGPWGGMAQTYMDMGQFDKAASTYELWLKVEPENALAKAGIERAKTLQTALATPQKPASSLPADILLAADRLSFRILAQQKDFTPADVNALVHDPSAMPRDGEFIWLDADSPNFHDPIRNARSAMLAFNKAPKVMIADGSWTIAAAFPEKDYSNRPCLMVKFDKRGAKAFGKLTADNIGRPLAIVIDDHIVSSPFIQSEISSAMVIGDFTDEDVMKMLRALLSKTPLVVEAQLFKVASATVLPAFLHDLSGMDYIAADKPFSGNVIISDEQSKKLIASLLSQPETKQLAAQRTIALSGEKAEVSIMAADPNLAAGNVKLSLQPYLLKKGRIHLHLNCAASNTAGQPQPAGAVPVNSMVIETKVRLEPGQHMLICGPGAQFVLVKIVPQEQAQPKPAR